MKKLRLLIFVFAVATLLSACQSGESRKSIITNFNYDRIKDEIKEKSAERQQKFCNSTTHQDLFRDDSPLKSKRGHQEIFPKDEILSSSKSNLGFVSNTSYSNQYLHPSQASKTQAIRPKQIKSGGQRFNGTTTYAHVFLPGDRASGVSGSTLAESTYNQRQRTIQIRERHQNGILTRQAVKVKTNYDSQWERGNKRSISVMNKSRKRVDLTVHCKPMDNLVCAQGEAKQIEFKSHNNADFESRQRERLAYLKSLRKC